ncbi:hypothetical protein EMIT0P291_20276 [Pseudomonas sp. IT-P291]
MRCMPRASTCRRRCAACWIFWWLDFRNSRRGMRACNPIKTVGASLLAIALDQSTSSSMNDCYREQARSYKGISVLNTALLLITHPR